MLGDEAYAGSRNFYRFEANVRKYYGYQYVVPTHQGRGAEHLIAKIFIRPGDYVPGNMYFTTTRLHQELAGGTFADVIIDEAHDAGSLHPFKGNVDLQKLEELIRKVGAEHIPYVSLAATVNMAGGQPVSMKNLRDLRGLCDRYGIPVLLDATRAIENAYFHSAKGGRLRGDEGRRHPEGILFVHGRVLDEREEGHPRQYRRLAGAERFGKVR